MMRSLIICFILSASAVLVARSDEKPASKYLNFISPSSKSYFIQRESKEIFQVMILKSNEELQRGFSGIRPEQVLDHQGLFFAFEAPSKKYFWMPDTYFNLMIIFLDKSLKVVALVKDAPSHPGISEKEKRIFRAPPTYAHYVLEFKASSRLAQSIKVGDQFTWPRNVPNFLQK